MPSSIGSSTAAGSSSSSPPSRQPAAATRQTDTSSRRRVEECLDLRIGLLTACDDKRSTVSSKDGHPFWTIPVTGGVGLTGPCAFVGDTDDSAGSSRMPAEHAIGSRGPVVVVSDVHPFRTRWRTSVLCVLGVGHESVSLLDRSTRFVCRLDGDDVEQAAIGPEPAILLPRVGPIATHG